MKARLETTGVQVIIGSAKLISPNQVDVTNTDGNTEVITAKRIIIASGSFAGGTKYRGPMIREYLPLKNCWI